jgi:hypothetical protein
VLVGLRHKRSSIAEHSQRRPRPHSGPASLHGRRIVVRQGRGRPSVHRGWGLPGTKFFRLDALRDRRAHSRRRSRTASPCAVDTPRCWGHDAGGCTRLILDVIVVGWRYQLLPPSIALWDASSWTASDASGECKPRGAGLGGLAGDCQSRRGFDGPRNARPAGPRGVFAESDGIARDDLTCFRLCRPTGTRRCSAQLACQWSQSSARLVNTFRNRV